jgi:hypothetical protein
MSPVVTANGKIVTSAVPYNQRWSQQARVYQTTVTSLLPVPLSVPVPSSTAWPVGPNPPNTPSLFGTMSTATGAS